MELPEVVRRYNRHPTNEEKETISQAVLMDQKVLDLLIQQRNEHLGKMERSHAILQERKKLWHEAIARSRAASQFYKELDSALAIFPQAALFQSPGALSEPESDSPHVTAWSHIVETRNSVTDQLSEYLNTAFDAAKKSQEAVTLAEESLQAALVIIDCHERRLRHLNNQIHSIQTSILSNRSLLQAVLKVPSDIWRMIFEKIVCLDSDITLPFNEESTWNMHGCRALVLSWVCRAWRSTVQSLPSLWRYIFLRLDGPMSQSAERLQHYRELSRRRPPILLLYIGDMPSNFLLAKEMLDNLQVQEFHKVSCILTPTKYKVISEIFDSLPLTVELELKAIEGTMENSHTRLLRLPSRMLYNLRALTQVDIPVHWTQESDPLGEHPAPNLESYSRSIRSGVLPGWLVSNPPNLRSLKLDISPTTSEDASQFRKLEMLEVPLHLLLSSLTDRCSFPSVHTLNISGTSGCPDTINFSRYMGSFNLPGIRQVVIQSLERHHVTGILTLLARFSGLATLHLWHKSTEVIFGDLISLMQDSDKIPSAPIITLVVHSCKGDLDALTSFLAINSELMQRKGKMLQHDNCGSPTQSIIPQAVFPRLQQIEYDSQTQNISKFLSDHRMVDRGTASSTL